jgi:ornithine decarboxylase
MDVGRTAGLQRQAYGEKEIPSHSRDPFLPIQILDLASNKKTPFLLFDMERLMRNYSILQGALKGAEIYYPVKSNDHPHILSTLHGLGSGFEAASWGELEGLLAIGVSPRRIIFGAPIKSIDGIASAYEAGVRLFAYDSYAEISKLSSAAPGCSVYLRLSVPFRGDSIFPLNGKFGVEPQEALQLLQAARKEGLEPCGLSFHVGSQCLEPSSWWRAIASAACVWEQALRAGLRMSILNLGGGIPIPYCDPVPDKEVFLSHIALALSSHFRDIPQLILEPGRAMVGDIAVMVGSVIGKAYREGKDWIYLDTGIYQGLVEAAQEPGRFSYRICTAGAGPLREYIIGGPTCDSSDVIARKVFLPEVECGDLLFIFNTGAYTNVCATNFNGFPPPQIYYLDYGEEVEQ